MAAGSSAELPPNENRVVQQLCDIGCLHEFRNTAHFVYRHEGQKCIVHLCGVASKVYTFTADWEIDEGWPQLRVADLASEHKEQTAGHRMLSAIQRDDGLAWLSTNGCFYLLRNPRMEETFSCEMVRLGSSSVIKRQNILCSCEIQGGLAVICSDDLEWIIDIYLEEPASDEDLSHITSYRMMHSEADVNLDCVPTVICIGINDMDPNLYKLLFGSDAFLLQSQVVIAGFSDGQVHAIILKDCSTIAVVDSQPILLCSLHQCIKGIHLTGTQRGVPNIITVIGEQGSIVVLQASVSLPLVVKVIESHVPGPVLACDFHLNVIHSDGSQIWLSSPAHMVGNEIQKSTTRRVNVIRGILQLNLLPRSADDEKPLAVMLTNTGRILTMKVDVLTKDDFRICSDTESGQTIASLLTLISACSTEVMEAKQESERQRNLIQTLATASTLLLDDKMCENFQTSCFVHQESLIRSQENKFWIKIENKGIANISRECWQVFVSVHLRKSGSTTQQCNASIPLRDDLNSGQSFIALLPVHFSTDLSIWELPCDLLVFLQLLVPEKYLVCQPGFTTHSNQENWTNEHFCSLASVKLKTFTIDELYILTVPVTKTDCTAYTDLRATDSVSRLDIWERASAKAGFQDTYDICPTSSIINRTTIPITPQVAKEIANHFKSTNIEDGLYAFICQNTEAVPRSCGIQELRTFCAGFPVTFLVRQDDKSIAVSVETNESFLTAKIRSALVRRFKEFQLTATEDTVESVAVGPAILAHAQRMVTHLEVSPELESAGQLQQALNLYHEIRTGIASKLPLVQNKLT